MFNHIDRLPPISIPQLDALRGLFKLGIAEAIHAQPPGDRHFADALANLVAYELVAALVARQGRELMAFGAGADRQVEPDGYNRVAGFMRLLDLGFGIDTYRAVDELDCAGSIAFENALDDVVAGIADALVVVAPEALVDGLSVGQKAELRAAVATTVGAWGRPDTLFVLEGVLGYLRAGIEPPAGEPVEWWADKADRAERIGEAAEAYFGPPDPRVGSVYAADIQTAGWAIDDFLEPFGVAGKDLEQLYRLIERWEMAYIADEPGGAAGTLVRNLGVDAAELYIECLQDAIAFARRKVAPTGEPGEHR